MFKDYIAMIQDLEKEVKDFKKIFIQIKESKDTPLEVRYAFLQCLIYLESYDDLVSLKLDPKHLSRVHPNHEVTWEKWDLFLNSEYFSRIYAMVEYYKDIKIKNDLNTKLFTEKTLTQDEIRLLKYVEERLEKNKKSSDLSGRVVFTKIQPQTWPNHFNVEHKKGFEWMGQTKVYKDK